MSTAVEEVRSSKEVAVSPNDSKPDSEHGSSDYYIDPVKESRMMRKFDVCLVFHFSSQFTMLTQRAALRSRCHGIPLLDVKSGPKQLGKRQHCRPSRGTQPRRQPIWNCNYVTVRYPYRLHLLDIINFPTSRFATYVPLEGPVAVLLKVIGPKPLMAISAFCWGSATLGMSK